MMQLYSVGIKHNNHLAFKYEVKKEIICHEVLDVQYGSEQNIYFVT